MQAHCLAANATNAFSPVEPSGPLCRHQVYPLTQTVTFLVGATILDSADSIARQAPSDRQMLPMMVLLATLGRTAIVWLVTGFGKET